MSEHSSNIETTIIPPEIPPAVFTGELAAEALPRPRSVRESIRNWREGRKPQLASAEDLRIVVSPAFHTRAVNSDNHLDAVRLVKLFESHYGVNFPFKRVYETDFWSHRLHNRPSVENLTSIVAVQEEKFIAHLAYDCNQCLGTAQILLPAVHPAYRSKLFALIRSFWQRIEQTAARQSWKLVYTYNPVSQPMLQMLSAKCFHCDAAALMPCSKLACEVQQNGSREPAHDSAVLVMYNVLLPDAEDLRVIYPPPSHRGKILDLFESFGLIREAINGVSKPAAAEEPKAMPCLSPRDARSYSMSFLQRFGIHQLRITSSGMADTEAAFELIERTENSQKYGHFHVIIQVPLDDPRCPKVCAELEDKGFGFCGILPLVNNHDYVCYAQYDESQLKRLTLYTENAKALRNYMIASYH